jgi:hypothetical protein
MYKTGWAVPLGELFVTPAQIPPDDAMIAAARVRALLNPGGQHLIIRIELGTQTFGIADLSGVTSHCPFRHRRAISTPLSSDSGVD